MSYLANNSVEIKCLEVTQPIGTFYVGVLNSADLVRLAYRDISRIEGERRDVETYLGIERPLSNRRVGQVQDYVATVDATFPSSIILAVPSFDEEGNEIASYDPSQKVLRLADRDDIAKILDGQHRLKGIEEFKGEKPFELIATIFVDIDLDSQAMIFATINLEQTKVNKSIAYDLYDYAKAPSPQKTGHDIVRFLDSREGSPFKDKLKILGTARSPKKLSHKQHSLMPCWT